jgi:riboflavin kinase/FMN adenylyltransferase
VGICGQIRAHQVPQPTFAAAAVIACGDLSPAAWQAGRVQRWRGVEATPSGWGRCVVTIGVFDGVHRGHQQIIGRAVERARAAGLPSVVLTFDPHPMEVVRPGHHPPMLTGPQLKAELLEALGVDVMCVLPFTQAFSRWTAAEFVHGVLVERLHAGAVVVGENFRYGHRGAGDVASLTADGRRFGFSVEGAPLQGSADTTWSSTYVRSCVAAGDVAGAAAALGRDHRIDGVVVRGDQRGRTIGYPTANLEPLPWSAVPADGIYAGRLVRASGPPLPAAISIGTNPTFAGQERRVEAFVIDAPEGLDLYGEHVGLTFAARLRDTLHFEGMEPLVAQMDRDVERARELLAVHPDG